MIFLEFVLFASLLALIFALLAYTINLAGNPSEQNSLQIQPFEDVLYNYLPWLIASLIATIIVHRTIFHRNLKFSGFGMNHLWTQFSKGVLLSLTILSIGFLILCIPGWIIIEKIEMNLTLFLGFLLFFIIQSSVEEIMLRSFLLTTIAHRIGIWPGIIISSLLFMLLHVDNPNISFVPLLNILMAGILLGIIYIEFHQIWAPIGFHAGWNFLQGSFFGFEVSGLGMYSLIDSSENGPDLFTGGSFGFEGSILAFIMLTILSWWIWKRSPHKFVGLYLNSTQQ